MGQLQIGHAIEDYRGKCDKLPTVTAVVINDGLMRSAFAIAKSRKLAGFGVGPQAASSRETRSELPSAVSTLAKIPFVNTDWTTLLGEGSLRRLHLLNKDVNEAFAKIGVGSPEPYAREGDPEEDFIDLYVGLLNVETIGQIGRAHV